MVLVVNLAFVRFGCPLSQPIVARILHPRGAEDYMFRTRDAFEEAEALRLRGVSDSEAAWRQERGAIEQEVAQNLSNPQSLLYAKLLTALFEGTPYAHDALGTKASCSTGRRARCSRSCCRRRASRRHSTMARYEWAGSPGRARI